MWCIYDNDDDFDGLLKELSPESEQRLIMENASTPNEAGQLES